MKLKTLMMGAAATAVMAPAAFAERGADGQVNIIMWQAPSTMNMYLSGGTKDIIAASMTLEPLARFTPRARSRHGSRPRPTAENGGISEDLRSVTSKLKPGVKWSDGTPLTSADVVFTANYCMDPKGEAARSWPSSRASKASRRWTI